MKSKIYPLRWWDFPAALLLMAALLTSGTRLVVTGWTVNLSIVQTQVFFGLIAGLALGYSRFSPRSVGFLAFIYGLFFTPWQLGLTLPLEYSWSERMIVLINRLNIIISQLVFREPVRDSLLFLVVMFALFWGISVHAGYSLTRHGDPWLAILPAGLTLFVIHSFDQAVTERVWYLAAYLFFGLILVARMTFVHHQSHWQESRTALPPHISLDFIRYTILATFIIVMFAWTVPALAKAVPQASKAWQPVRTAWNETIDNFENAFASLKATIFTYTAVYSPTSSLGRGSILSDSRIFHGKAPLDLPSGVRLYWRARVYDFYNNGQWRTTQENTRNFDPLTDELTAEPTIGRWQGKFSVISAANITTLFTPSQPIWVSRNGKIEFTGNPDGSVDVATFSAASPLGPGESYDVLASISDPSIDELRSASIDYPPWVTDRYLQMPDSITSRTKELANQITAGFDNPYDKAAAITQYLRNNIQYVEVLDEAPPADQEPIDWFLFDSKKGFCNYYSSAEIIMLRSIGIPARWAVGYAQGELLDDTMAGYSSDALTYVVRQRDAHAWPEVYFTGVGWVEFEPTVSQPIIQRLQDSANSQTDLTADDELAALREDQRLQRLAERNQDNQDLPLSAQADPYYFLRLTAGLVVGIGLILFSLRFLPMFGLPTAPALLDLVLVRAGIETPGAFKRWATRPSKYQTIKLPPLPILLERAFQKSGLRAPKFIQRWARHAELPPLSKAYMEINRGLRLTGQPADMTDTPAERAEALGERLPPANQPAHDLVSQYQIGTFGHKPQPVNLELAQKSAAEIKKISFRAFFRRYLQKFQKADRGQQLNLSKSKHTIKPEE
jgi:transglutaminase-like putative cysteine protease